MHKELSYKELLEWMAYAKIEPFGEERMDHRVAHMMAFYANANRDPKMHPEPFKISDFILQYNSNESGNSDGEESGDGSGDWKPKISKEQQLNNLRLWKTFF